MMMMIMVMMMMIMVRHMTAVVNRDLAPDALTWNQAKLGEEGFCKRFFSYLWFTPDKTMTAQARFMVSQGNCPCLTSGRTAKDSVAQTLQTPRGQDDLGFAWFWGILQRFGHSLYYWEKLFSVPPRTEGFHLRWCPWSWRNCDTGAMKRAKPHIPEMRQNQSGDEYQADD